MPGVVEVSTDDAPTDSTTNTTAPIHTVPQERVVSIEHPCIVRNFDNGIKSLGGEPQMKHVSSDINIQILPSHKPIPLIDQH